MIYIHKYTPNTCIIIQLTVRVIIFIYTLYNMCLPHVAMWYRDIIREKVVHYFLGNFGKLEY